MFEKLLTMLAKKLFPNRDISVKKIGNKYLRIAYDTTGCRDYLLKGKYTYDEVEKLNALTSYNASYGFCEELGPVAFIGIPNVRRVGINGFFFYNVHEYAKKVDNSEYYFEAYTPEEAKKIANYTVYGLRCKDVGFEKICEIARIDKISYIYDSRCRLKKAKCKKIYDMDCKLTGTYSFNEAKLLATGTTGKKEWFSGDEEPIIFATVGENYHVGIIGILGSTIEFIAGFRDVWEYGAKEPEIQTIKILTEEEANNIQCFSLYLYDVSYGIPQKYDVEKYDRTFDKRFNFYMEDGSDYRLIRRNELFV